MWHVAIDQSGRLELYFFEARGLTANVHLSEAITKKFPDFNCHSLPRDAILLLLLYSDQY